MPGSGVKLGAVAAALALVLLVASSFCVVNCLAADNPGVPPCHRHAPSNADACSHTALTAVEQTLCAGAVAATITSVQISEAAVQDSVAEAQQPDFSNGPSPVIVLRV